jgi:integrase
VSAYVSMSRLSRAGKRTVPIASVLREHLIAHRLRSGRVHGLVFGREATRPFNPTTLYGRAATAWKRMNVQRAERNENPIAPIGLHEARHTFASVMIAAGVNIKALSAFMGHSSISITMDRYGHLLPGAEGEAASLLDAYLKRAVTG